MLISVIVPVYNGGSDFIRCLADLKNSSLCPHQVLIVDDGSADGSSHLARTAGYTVLSTPKPRSGPAIARNIGAQAATGDILFFLDADVCVHVDSVARVDAAFRQDPALDALIGSYDDKPADPDFLSQYKNLMHAYVHQSAHQQASTFWSGCGAVRRDVFLAHSGFDESYRRPAIEDIELGFRMSAANRKMELDKDLRVKHLKRWTFWKLLRTDVMDRGIPWTELILRDRSMPNDLNLQISQRVSVALAFLSFFVALGATVYFKGYALTPLFGLVLFFMARYWVGNEDSPPSRFVFMTIGLAALIALAYAYHMLSIVPPIVLGYALLFLRHRYSFASKSHQRFTSFAFIVYGLLTTLFILTYLPGNILTLTLALAVIAIVILNNEFYVFLAAKRGKAFALAAVPFHLLYHFYNGVSFSIGLLRHSWRTLTSRKRGVIKSC